jgi:hypothetical protein
MSEPSDAALRAAYRVDRGAAPPSAPEGPWKVDESADPQPFQWWSVYWPRMDREYYFHPAEAIAVRDALNRVAASPGGASSSPPEEPHRVG